MSKQLRRSDCPINFALEIFGDKWTLLVIRDLMFKEKHHYVEFLQSEEKIATNILADRLLILEKSGIILKQKDPAHGSKFIYKLSSKGIDLLPVLVEIIIWSYKYDANTAAEKKFINEAMLNKEELIKNIATRIQAESELLF